MKPIKFIKFRQYCKYALITVALIMLILSALLFYNNTSNVKAADETVTQNTGDFTMNNIFNVYDVEDSENPVKFSAGVHFGSNKALNSEITKANYNTNIEYAFGIKLPVKVENYIVVVITKDVSNFYKLEEYHKSTYSGNIDGFFEDCLPNCECYILTNGASDIADKQYNLSSMSDTNFDVTFNYTTYDKNTTYYAFAISFTSTTGSGAGLTVTDLLLNYKTDNYVEFNESKSIQTTLNTANIDTPAGKLKDYHSFLGLNADGNTTVNVNFLKMKSFTEYENATLSFVIPTIYSKSTKVIEEYLYNTLSEYGYDKLMAFNATYKDSYVDANGNHLDLSEKIVRSATGLSFTPEFNNNKVQTVNVTYSDFDYSNLALYVSNNGYDIDTELLTMAVYTTDVTMDSDNNVIITFNYDTIERQLYNSVKWLFELNSNNVTINGKADSITVNVTDENIVISFNPKDEPDLFGLNLVALAEIMEDYEITYNIKYIELDDNLTATTLTSDDYVCWYSEFVNLTNSKNFYDLYGTVIDEAISPAILNNTDYYKYKGVATSSDKENATAVFTVKYNYNTLFKIISSSGVVYYTELYKDTFEYTLGDLNFALPTGFRVCNVTTTNPYVKVGYLDSDPFESVIRENIQNNTSNILDIYVDITDMYYIDVNYLVPYYSAVDGALTPFFELKTITKEEKVSALGKSIYDFNVEDVCSFIGVETLNNSTSSVDYIDVVFNNPTYTLNVIYNPTTVNRIDYDGNIYEILVSPTSYANWLEFYGKEWTIRFLNMPGKQYFKYVDDIEPDKLYGYFSVAIFEEQVSDFNYYFQQDSGAGCMSFYKSTEVNGSALYEFFGGLSNSVLFGYGYVGMALCEIVDNENAIYSSYFFYVDGTSDDMYLSNGGADSSKDQNSALGNGAQDFGDWLNSVDLSGIADFFENQQDFISWITTAGIIVGVIALIGFALYVFLKKGKLK